MKRSLTAILVAALLVGCQPFTLHDPYSPPLNYIRDDLYCWHLGQDRVWHVAGLSRECPDNAPMGTVWAVPKP